MKSLRLYGALSRFRFLNYPAKIMVVAFIGTHIPLIALVADVARRSTSDWPSFLGVLGVALAATLAGTGVTLLVLSHLLRPVLMTSAAFRAYRETRAAYNLPEHFLDEAGTLMADAGATLRHLEAARVRLEHFDAGTGLANRAKLALEVAARIEAGTPFALCVVGMNCHGRLEATVDQATAEASAKLMALRLQDFLGPRVALARIAADRFAYVGEQADGEGWGAVSEALQDLMMSCGMPLRLDAMPVQPQLTAGIATFPSDGATTEDLIDCATAAAALVGGRTQVSFFSRQVRQEALDQFRIEQELRGALRDNQFVLHYQPVVDVSQGRAVGVEALIRWNHPELGMVPPNRFIPVAERSGLIGDIGLWVMDAACAQVAEWNRTGLGGLKVAINLSARQFHDPALIDHVRVALERNAVDAGQLEVELTESAAMDDYAHTRTIFGKLRDMGVSISIDDFGTGFASLSYLRRLPFDKLKVDREFVMNVHALPESQAICRSLVASPMGSG